MYKWLTELSYISSYRIITILTTLVTKKIENKVSIKSQLLIALITFQNTRSILMAIGIWASNLIYNYTNQTNWRYFSNHFKKYDQGRLMNFGKCFSKGLNIGHNCNGIDQLNWNYFEKNHLCSKFLKFLVLKRL